MAGGYLGTEVQWGTFEREWRTALHSAGVKVFHATDFFSCREEFAQWEIGSPRHTKYAKRFAAIAEKHTATAIGRGVVPSAFAEIIDPLFRKYPPVKSGRFTSQTWCASTLLFAASRIALPRGERIAAIFEQESGIGLVVDYFNFLKRRHVSWTERFVSVGTGDKGEFVPLQGADLLAHESWRRAKEVLSPTGRAERKTFKRLVAGDRVDIKIATASDMRHTLPALERYLQDESD
jgi:hypothetical protein